VRAFLKQGYETSLWNRAGFFKEAVAAGYENEEVAALIKVFRSGFGAVRDLVNGSACDGDPSRYNSKVKRS